MELDSTYQKVAHGFNAAIKYFNDNILSGACERLPTSEAVQAQFKKLTDTFEPHYSNGIDSVQLLISKYPMESFAVTSGFGGMFLFNGFYDLVEGNTTRGLLEIGVGTGSLSCAAHIKRDQLRPLLKPYTDKVLNWINPLLAKTRDIESQIRAYTNNSQALVATGFGLSGVTFALGLRDFLRGKIVRGMAETATAVGFLALSAHFCQNSIPLLGS